MKQTSLLEQARIDGVNEGFQQGSVVAGMIRDEEFEKGYISGSKTKTHHLVMTFIFGYGSAVVTLAAIAHLSGF